MLRSWVVRIGGECPKRTPLYAFTEVRGSYFVQRSHRLESTVGRESSVVNHSSEIQQRSIISHTLVWVLPVLRTSVNCRNNRDAVRSGANTDQRQNDCHMFIKVIKISPTRFLLRNFISISSHSFSNTWYK
jgi:hypothetical protein